MYFSIHFPRCEGKKIERMHLDQKDSFVENISFNTKEIILI